MKKEMYLQTVKTNGKTIRRNTALNKVFDVVISSSGPFYKQASSEFVDVDYLETFETSCAFS